MRLICDATTICNVGRLKDSSSRTFDFPHGYAMFKIYSDLISEELFFFKILIFLCEVDQDA
jgi:hypothetical protein